MKLGSNTMSIEKETQNLVYSIFLIKIKVFEYLGNWFSGFKMGNLGIKSLAFNFISTLFD